MCRYAFPRKLEIVRVQLYADAVTSPTGTSQIRRSCSHEGIEHGISYKGEHSNQPFSQLERIRRRVFRTRRPRKITPNLAEPALIIILADNAEESLAPSGAAVAARLSLHEHKFNIVLDDRVRFVGFAQESASAGHFV